MNRTRSKIKKEGRSQKFLGRGNRFEGVKERRDTNYVINGGGELIGCKEKNRQQGIRKPQLERPLGDPLRRVTGRCLF